MKIAKNVEMLDIAVPRGEQVAHIYPTLTWDDKHLVLFDTGFPGTAGLIADAIRAAGFEPSALTEIILTHQDIDHIGGANDLLKLAPDAQVYAHEVDAPFIQGDKVPTKLDGLQKRIDAGETLSAGDTGFHQMLKNGFPASYVKVDHLLKDSEWLDFCGEIKVVFTPGHTPGHAAFYLKESKIMVVGDAANIVGDQLQGSNPAMTWDMHQAESSLERIKSYDLNGVISYHTGYLKA